MAIVGNPEASKGVLGSIKGALGLFSDTNKAQGVNENSNPIPIDEYESSLDEKEVLELISSWKKTYSVYYDPIDKTQELAFAYWIGNQKADENLASKDDKQGSDNLIFESIETFLPIATRANPDPLVSADPSEIGQQLAHDIKVALVNEADTQKLRRKLAKMTRHWILYRIGVAKVVWDFKIKAIRTEITHPRRMIFDKDGYIDDGGHFVGEYLGEKKKASAKVLISMFPKKRERIMAKAKGKMGTKLEYFEWWYKKTDIIFSLDDDLVLGKYKNPNWNYDGEEISIDPSTNEEIRIPIQGTNHLKEPTYPYLFLSLFTTGLHPHDDTSLVLQNIPNQDRINRRNRQIEDNVDGMNEGMVVSGKSFTEEQASQAAAAWRKKKAIRVPDGEVEKAIKRFPAPALPSDVFNDRNDARAELRNIFGTSGSTPQGTQSEDTVRGKILVNQQDSSRIGGGITEQIEQVADSIYNMWVQFFFVYFDEEHFVTTAGAQGGMELIALKNANFPLLKTLSVTVKEGSLIPKDPLTQRNEAIDLWSAGAIDPLNFFKKLDFPDPAQATQQLILWQLFQKGLIPAQAYLPSFQAPQVVNPEAMPPQQGVGGPAVNNIDASSPQPQQAIPQSQGAVQAQSQQLLGAIPVQ